MKVPKRIVARISRTLEQELALYRGALAVPHQKLFAPVVLGLLRASSCYVSETARELEDWGTSMEAREDQLLNFVHSPKLKLPQLRRAHVQRLKTRLKGKKALRIYADLSDLSKPFAEVMDALDTVRDGSDPEKRKRPGYWLNEVYVHVSPQALIPACLEPFSTKEEGFLSQNALILDAMEEVYEATEGRGTWIADRGYDNKKFLSASWTRAVSSSSGSSRPPRPPECCSTNRGTVAEPGL